MEGVTWLLVEGVGQDEDRLKELMCEVMDGAEVSGCMVKLPGNGSRAFQVTEVKSTVPPTVTSHSCCKFIF